jgi:hypothetical protein
LKADQSRPVHDHSLRAVADDVIVRIAHVLGSAVDARYRPAQEPTDCDGEEELSTQCGHGDVGPVHHR